ncbi:MAG: hypothetical protein WAV21_03065, partial [Minisyncoccia bacterium]
DDTLQIEKLPIELQTGLRLDLCRNEIQRIEQAEKPAVEKARSIDWWYHQVVAIIEVGGKLSDNVFKTAFDFLEEAGKQGLLRPGVRARATRVIAKISPKHALHFDATCVASGGHSSLEVVPVAIRLPERKGPSAEVLRKKHKRTERDQEARAEARGPTGSKPQYNNGKKGKK